MPEELKDELKTFVDKVLDAYEMAMTISSEIKILAETSFGGVEAHKVMELVEQLKVKEWEADKAQMEAAKKMFSIEKKLDPVSVMMCSALTRPAPSESSAAWPIPRGIDTIAFTPVAVIPSSLIPRGISAGTSGTVVTWGTASCKAGW